MSKFSEALFLAGLVFVSPLFPQALDEALTPYAAERIEAKGSAKAISSGTTSLALCPLVRIDSVRSRIEEFGPSVVVEALYAYEKPARASGRSWTDAERQRVYQALRSIHGLEGMEYYSASRKAMRTFYDKSYAIDGPKTKNRVPDPGLGPVPASERIFALQRDLTFGENVYRYEYGAAPKALWFEQTNLTTMSYGILPLVGPEKLRTILVVADTDAYLLLYAVVAANPPAIPGVQGKMKDSFSNRSDALYRWFSKEISAAF